MRLATQKISKMAIVLTSVSFLVTGCGKKAEVTNTPNKDASKEIPKEAPNQPATQTPATPNKIKAVSIGQAENFVILAYAGITSVPNSSIDGKVGLMPGTHDQITLLESEVTGGAADILGSEDESEPANLLSNAKVDMVTSYTKLAALEGDKDKINLYAGDIGGKTLVPGCYQWPSSMTIDKNITLDGTDKDVWIFKVQGNLEVNEGVHLTLTGGAKASNVYWQVAGGVILGSNSNFAGLIFAQPSIEMKNHAVLTGRAFVKNGFVNLNQATINRP